MDWSKLEHAYGPATDIPPLLEALKRGSDDAAHDKLANSLVHQGSVFEPAYYVIDDVGALLDDDARKDLPRVLALLIGIAVGQTYPLPRGLKEPKKPAKKAVSPAGCYHRVKAFLPRVLALLAHPSGDVRTHAAFFLAWFPSEAKKSIAALNKALAKETNAAAAASMALSLACLGAKTIKVTTPKDELLRDAHAVATAIVTKKLSDDLVNATRAPNRPSFPWGDGSLADLAVAVMPKNALEGLVAATLARNEDAALRLIDKVFPLDKPAPKTLDAKQTRAIEALLDGKMFTSEVVRALEKRNLPSAVSALLPLVGRQPPARPTPLDDVVGAAKIRERLLAAVIDNSWKQLANEVLEALPPERCVALALDVDELLGLKGWGDRVNRAHDFCFELIAVAGPRAPKALREQQARIERDGPGKKDNPFGGLMDCEINRAILAVGLAHDAIARGETVCAPIPEQVRIGGFRDRVVASLAALTPDDRDAWLLHEDNDDEDQPSEDHPGGWLFFERWPSPRITERVIELASKWKPKDRWDQPRAKHADPFLKRYAAALRARGDEADAARVESLAK